jgi:ribonucleoside-diphosphate reductase subunit M2
MSFRDYIYFPDRDPVSQDFYKRQEACDWSAEEFKFTKERDDYLQASLPIRNLFKKIIGFFLIGDGLISEALIKYINKAVKERNWPKVYYLCMQLKIENTHAETYSKAALTIVPEEEHQQIIDMCEEKDCLKKKAEWITKNCDHENEGLEQVACAIAEGIFFVSQFAIIFYMRKLNIFKNFIESNEQISKDETLHRDQKCHEAKESLKAKIYNVEDAVKLIKDGVEIEKKFARDLLIEPVLGEQADIDAGLTIENLDKYIEKLGDEICYLIGLPLIYKNEDVKLGWMEDINLSQKTNFYERDVVGSYRKFNPIKEEEKDENITFNNPELTEF